MFLLWDVQISKEAQEYMIEEYKHLRQRDCTGAGKSSWRITVRQLESMIRLSESMARMHCQEEVSHVRCLDLLMPRAQVLDVSFQRKALYSRAVLPSLSVQPAE